MSNKKVAPAPKSNSERQAALRARRAQANLVEVRGIYASAENARLIKEFAKGLK